MLKDFVKYELTVEMLIALLGIVLITSVVVTYRINNNDAKVVQIQQEMTALKNSVESQRKINSIEKDISTIKAYIDFLAESEFDEKYLQSISTTFYHASKRFNVDPKILVAIAWQESRFIPTRRSPAGARGIMQIMPLWVKDKKLVREIGLNSVSDLHNPTMGIYAGAYIYSHYRDQWKKYGISDRSLVKIVLLSYNRGNKTVKNRIEGRVDPENGYSISVRNKFNKLVKLDEIMS